MLFADSPSGLLLRAWNLIIRTVSATALTTGPSAKVTVGSENHHRSFIVIVFAFYHWRLSCLTGLEGRAGRGTGFICVVQRSNQGIDIVPFDLIQNRVSGTGYRSELASGLTVVVNIMTAQLWIYGSEK